MLRHVKGRGCSVKVIVHRIWCKVDEPPRPSKLHQTCILFPTNLLTGLVFLLQYSVPKSVRRLSVFKDFNNQLKKAIHNSTRHLGPSLEDTLNADRKLAKAFAARSQHLECLSISYMIDAQQFFTSCQQLPCTWNLLQSLTLTSSTLARTAPRQNIYTLLRNASSVALKMPQLQTMVLWNNVPGQACAVIYQRHTASAIATLTWRSTWNLELSDDVVESWKEVASGPCYLQLEKEALHDVDIRSHGDAIHHLRLPNGVVDSESLCQIRYEGTIQRMA